MLNLSYILSTRNRLPFLKVTLEKLFEFIQSDEEIVVVDGNSTDGSKEYLQELFERGEIHQFISEPDKNQAHGWNKAMLMANGTLIKKIIDDDVFCYSSIRKCKEYMLSHSSTDVIISNDLSCNILTPSVVSAHSRYGQFQNWVAGKIPSFTFGDVHMLIRKSSLAYIGLYRTDFVMMDWEYSLRISYLMAKITYYTGYNALSVGHPESISALKNLNLIRKQGQLMQAIYEYNGDGTEITWWSKMKIFIGKIIFRKGKATQSDKRYKLVLKDSYDTMYNYIETTNHNIDAFEFISKPV